MTALVTEHPHLEVEPTLRELHIAPSNYYRWRRARRNRAFGLSAGGAWAPAPGLRSGAGAADGGVGGAGVDAAEPSADGAVSRASVAAAADRAEECGQGVNERRAKRLLRRVAGAHYCAPAPSEPDVRVVPASGSSGPMAAGN